MDVPRPTVYKPSGTYIGLPGGPEIFVRHDASGQEAVLAALWAQKRELNVHLDVVEIGEALVGDSAAPAAGEVCVRATVHFIGKRWRGVDGRERVRFVDQREKNEAMSHAAEPYAV
jgi:hypothetical protein